MGRHRYQPQGAARLDRRNKFAAGAQAILSAPHATNLASAQPVSVVGTGYQRVGVPAGVAWPFRKNFYVETEALTAIGTASFVEFWIGYPSSDPYSRGDPSAPGFLTGHSKNQIGIAGTVGTNSSNTGSPDSKYWGAVYNWPTLNHAGEALTPGQLTKIMVVRRQTGTELWRDGRMMRFVSQSPNDCPAGTMICGSFVENTDFWSSAGDTLLAGRILTPVEPTADEIRQFFANPYQIFADLHDDYAVDELRTYTMTASPGSFSAVGLPARLIAARNLAAASGTFVEAGAPVKLLASRKLAATGGAYALDGAAARLLAGRRVIASAGAYTLSGAAAALRAARRMTAAPGAFTLSSAGMQMVYTPAPGAAGPTYVLGAAPGSFGLAAAPAGLRAGRRLAAGAGSFGSAGAAAGLRAARRLRADGGSFIVAGSAVVLKYSSSAGPIDVSQISLSHIAVFDGTGSRVAVFGGTGARTGINGMATKLPAVVNGKMQCDRDPDEISWYGADITQELADRNTTPDASKLTLDLLGVAVAQVPGAGPAIQTATAGGVTRTYVVVLLCGVDGALPADWRWTARVTCANGERFDKTTYFNRVDT